MELLGNTITPLCRGTVLIEKYRHQVSSREVGEGNISQFLHVD